MKRRLYAVAAPLLLLAQSVAAAENVLGLKPDNLRTGNVTTADIPIAIAAVTKNVFAASAVVSVVAIVGGALKMQMSSFGSSASKAKAKDVIGYGAAGFAISASAWLIVRVIIASLS